MLRRLEIEKPFPGFVRAKLVLELKFDIEYDPVIDEVSYEVIGLENIKIPEREMPKLLEFQKEIRLLVRANEVLEALEELVNIEYKVKHTNQEEYERRKPLAWDKARRVIAKVRGEG